MSWKAALLWVAPLAMPCASATGSPPVPAVSRAEVVDGETQHPRRAIHDVERAWVEIAGGMLKCGVRMRRPVLEGTHVTVSFTFDADDDPATGPEGGELWVKGERGSYCRRMSDTGADTGLPPAISFASASYALARREEDPKRGSTPRQTSEWSRHEPLPALRVVGDKELHLEVPAQRLIDAGMRYNTMIAWHAIVVGAIYDRPITLLVRLQDEGTDIKVDGRTSDWSVTARVDDVVGETHPDVAELDMASLAVDHGPQHLFLLLGMAREGFRTEAGDDVLLDDMVTVAMDPAERDGAYMPYTEREIYVRSTPADTVVAKDGPWLEVAIPRRPEQTSLRVFAWTQAQRADRVPDKGKASLDIVPGSLR